MFCVESRCFFTSLMNENLFSCLTSGGSFSHITVALYEIVCFLVFVLTLVLWHILCCGDEHLWHIADMCQRYLVMPSCANDERISKHEALLKVEHFPFARHTSSQRTSISQ